MSEMDFSTLSKTELSNMLAELIEEREKIGQKLSDNKDMISSIRKEIRRREGAEENKKLLEFKKLLEARYNLENNSKFEVLFARAWELGHSCGYSEVEHYFEELVELIL
jgi:hypothetical protein